MDLLKTFAAICCLLVLTEANEDMLHNPNTNNNEKQIENPLVNLIINETDTLPKPEKQNTSDSITRDKRQIIVAGYQPYPLPLPIIIGGFGVYGGGFGGGWGRPGWGGRGFGGRGFSGRGFGGRGFGGRGFGGRGFGGRGGGFGGGGRGGRG